MLHNKMRFPSPRGQCELLNAKKSLEACLEDQEDGTDNEITYHETIMHGASKSTRELFEEAEDLGPWEAKNQSHHSILTNSSREKKLSASTSTKFLRSHQKNQNELSSNERPDSKAHRPSSGKTLERRCSFSKGINTQPLTLVFNGVSESSSLKLNRISYCQDNPVTTVEAYRKDEQQKTDHSGPFTNEIQNSMLQQRRIGEEDGSAEELPYSFSRILRTNASRGGSCLLLQGFDVRPETTQHVKTDRLMTAITSVQTESLIPKAYFQNALIQRKSTAKFQKLKHHMNGKKIRKEPSLTLNQFDTLLPTNGLSPKQVLIGNSISLKKPEQATTDPTETDRLHLKIEGISQPVVFKPKFRSKPKANKICSHIAENGPKLSSLGKGNLNIPFAKKFQADGSNNVKDKLKILKKTSYNQDKWCASPKQDRGTPKHLFVIKKFNPKFFTVTIETSPKADQFKLSFLSPNTEAPQQAILNISNPKQEVQQVLNTNLEPRALNASYAMQMKTQDANHL